MLRRALLGNCDRQTDQQPTDGQCPLEMGRVKGKLHFKLVGTFEPVELLLSLSERVRQLLVLRLHRRHLLLAPANSYILYLSKSNYHFSILSILSGLFIYLTIDLCICTYKYICLSNNLNISPSRAYAGC